MSKCNLSRLCKFKGLKTEISFYFINQQNADSLFFTSVFNHFNYNLDEEDEYIRLFDSNENKEILDSLEQSEVLIKLSDIQEITYIDEDICKDVISFKTNDFIIALALISKEEIESPLPRCEKCNTILDEFSHPWFVNQQAGYNSQRDGNLIDITICNNCFEEMFGILIPSDKGGELQ